MHFNYIAHSFIYHVRLSSAISSVRVLEPVEGSGVCSHNDRSGLRVLMQRRYAVLATHARVLHAAPGRGGVVAVMVVDPNNTHLFV